MDDQTDGWTVKHDRIYYFPWQCSRSEGIRQTHITYNHSHIDLATQVDDAGVLVVEWKHDSIAGINLLHHDVVEFLHATDQSASTVTRCETAMQHSTLTMMACRTCSYTHVVTSVSCSQRAAAET